MTRSLFPSVGWPASPSLIATWRSLALLAVCSGLLIGASGRAVSAQDGTEGCLPPVALAPAAVSPTVAASPGASPKPSPGPEIAPLASTVVDSAGNDISVVRAPVGGQPMGIAIDSSDTWGRAFVADRAADRVSVIFGRSPDLTIDCQLRVGTAPYSVALDADTGRALVTLRGEPRLAIVDGRADEPRVLGWLDLAAVPGWVAIDQPTGRAFVSLPELGQVAVLEPDPAAPFFRQAATIESGPYPRWLAVDQASGRLFVSNDGQPETVSGDLGNGSVTIFDARKEVPERLWEPIPASVPSGIAFDPSGGSAYVVENGTDQLMTLTFPGGGGAPSVDRMPVDPYVDEGQNVNPVDLVFLPSSRELMVTQASSAASPIGGHLVVFQVDEAGRPTLDRTVPSAQHTTGIALDPVSGRVLVSYLGEGVVAALDAAEPSQAAPPSPIAEAMPGPLEISFAPQDVARTVGISLLVLLLVGAPTPIFNETLESNLGQIQGGLRRLVPGGSPSGVGSSGWARWSVLSRVAEALRRLSGSVVGLLVYLVAAAVIYSFLTPGFPSDNGLLVFGVAFLGLALVTASDILPGQRYVVHRYADHGVIRVAVWTLGLAAVCVLISRISGMQPGYMYGIIGTFTFVAALGLADEGRMEARGAVALLVLALAAWFARIPFEPTPGVPSSGPELTINFALVGIFVIAVEGLVFGLVPLRFLPGQRIWAWSRWRWAVLWGAGLALFAHVLVYPVTVAQPNPDPSSLTTTLASVAVYGAVAVGFWLFFRWRGRPDGGAEETDGEGPATEADD